MNGIAMALQLLRLACLTSPHSQSTSFPSLRNNAHNSQSININPSFRFPRLSLTTSKQALNPIPSLASDSQQQTAVEEFSRTRLLAQNVPWTSTPEDIRSLFEKHGRVLEVELSMYKKDRNRGLAFVEMGSPEEALAALNNLEAYEFEGRVMKVNYARPKKIRTPPPAKSKLPVTFNLFVANLSYEARSKDLREFFNSGAGKVVSAEVVFNENPRKPSGYGFVSFKSKKEAEAALTEFQGKEFMGRPIRVDRSRRFAQQLVVGSGKSEDTSPELSGSAESEASSAALSMNGKADKTD